MRFLGEGADVEFSLEVLGRIVPRKWKDCTVLTGESHRVMGVSGAVFFLKFTTISDLLRALSSKLFWLHQVTRLSASHL